MPYKVVSTVEKGKAVLTCIPSGWEKNGFLYWPPKGHEKLRKDENSSPESNWKRYKCIVKRLNIATLDRAEYEISRMCNASETETDNEENNPRKVFNRKEPTFDDIVQECILNTETPSIEDELSETRNVENVAVIIQQSQPEESSNMNVEEYVNVDTERQLDVSDIFNILLTKIDAVSDNLNTIGTNIMESVQSLQENQKILLESQQAVMLSLSKLGVQFEQIIKRYSRAADTKETFESMQPISCLEDLIKMETSLDDPDAAGELKKRFSVICGKGKGRGINNAYLLVDVMFDRRFLQQCSWAGGSRSSHQKICFRSHTAIINFFFNMVNDSDNLFTLVECHNFFKNILKNSGQRIASKNMRTSATKNRPKLKRNRIVNPDDQEITESSATKNRPKLKRNRIVNPDDQEITESSDKENNETFTRANQVQSAAETSSQLNQERPVYLTDVTSSRKNRKQIPLPADEIVVAQVHNSLHLETFV